MLSPPPSRSKFDDQFGNPAHSWIEWFTSLYRSAKSYKGHGTTAKRPTNGLEIGDYYWDETIQKPIWWNGTIWKDSSGSVV